MGCAPRRSPLRLRAAAERLNTDGKTVRAKETGMCFLNNVQAAYDKQHKRVEKYVMKGKGLGEGGEFRYRIVLAGPMA